jgi:rod shape-determining protein MreB
MIDLTKLRGLNIIYIKLYENRVIIRDVNTQVNIDRKSLEPFSNSRLLLADFTIAEKFIREILNELYGKRMFQKALAVLIQPMEKTEGGLSQVEKVSFNDLVMHIGGKYVKIEENKLNIDDVSVKQYFK